VFFFCVQQAPLLLGECADSHRTVNVGDIKEYLICQVEGVAWRATRGHLNICLTGPVLDELMHLEERHMNGCERVLLHVDVHVSC
jgi:hypothetical protein